MRRRTENKPRKRMSAEDRRKAILETTVSFISQFGFWGFTIRDVAQAQNITEAGLLYYFKSKEQLLEETLKYADRTNQIAIAEHLGVQGVTGEVLDDGIAYHCDLGLKAISTGTVETNADRPEMVRLYTLLESEALSKDHTIIFKGMQKEYPNTIYLYIEERKTVAAMQWLGILYTLDREGVVMEESTSTTPPAGMPVITGFRVSNINVGQRLTVRSEKQMDAYREIMEELELQMYQSQVAEINLADPSNIYLIMVEGVTVRLGDASYMQAKIGAVRTDMAYLRQLGKTSGILDVTIPEDAKYMPEN